MFQDFRDIGGPEHGRERLNRLRDLLASEALSGFIQPRSDAFQNEFVAPEDERLLWLTGFSGSWGTAIILREKAALFIDGRYTLQAEAQVDGEAYEIVNIADVTMAEWLEANLQPDDRIAYDPLLHTIAQIDALHTSFEKVGARLAPLADNPVDRIWTDRPSSPPQPAWPHPIALAGVEARDKLAQIQDRLTSQKNDAVIINALDSIAWLFNIRGHDIPHTPFVKSYAIVPAEGKAQLFIDRRKLGPELDQSLAEVAEIAEPPEMASAIQSLGAEKASVQLDPANASQWFWNALTEAGAAVIKERDPCILPKARKTEAEIKGSRAAHLRDGVAMSRFLSWLDRTGAGEELDEIRAATALEAFRRETNKLRDISFDTIAGAGPNGAVVHYRPSESTNRKLEPGSLFLIDSGGQYEDGTTDVTRTVAIGEPTSEMRRHYTLVLKGHIAIASLRFPKGTRGSHIDAMARRPLWEAGLDYDHGTGHGVGSFLSVHEGPQSIARRESVPLEPGMILSNEPGYYRAGQYGIRLENLILVTEPEDIAGGDRPVMHFETLTLVPFDRRLIDPALLRLDEAEWIDSYHRTVWSRLSVILEGDALDWLSQATAPIARSA